MEDSFQNQDKITRKLQSFGKIEGITVLLVFLLDVIIAIYLISLLLIFLRKLKNVLKSRKSTRAYYLVVFIYIATKLILCSILLIQIISQMPNQWQQFQAENVQIVLKNSIQLADLTTIQLFLIALYTYLKMCFISMDRNENQKINNLLLISVKILIGIATLTFIVPLIIFDFKIINYELLNGISLGFNCFTILAFLASFFYLNFKMTGLMVEQKLNSVIKKLYKVLIIILVSRILMVAVQFIIAVKIHDGSFQSFMEILEELNGQIQTFGVSFVSVTVIILLTEGLPMMYSLRKSVLEAFSLSIMFRDRTFNNLQSILTSNSSVLGQQLIKDNLFEYDSQPQIQNVDNLRLARFKNVCDLKDRDDSIWNVKRGQISGEDFIIRMVKHQISSYLIQDVETQISKWNQLKLSHLNPVTCFKQKDHMCIVQKFLPYNLDSIVDKTQNPKDLLFFALDIAKGIEQFHKNQLAHGSLKPSYIWFDSHKKIFFTGLGLQSLKKYLSLVTGYSNKSMYSAVQILADKNTVTIKPTLVSDVYSFGMIFYEMITKNRIYRDQTLKQCRQKFYEQKARPKIPQSFNSRIKSLIRNCWQDDSSKRPNISEVILNLKKIIDQN